MGFACYIPKMKSIFIVLVCTHIVTTIAQSSPAVLISNLPSTFNYNGDTYLFTSFDTNTVIAHPTAPGLVYATLYGIDNLFHTFVISITVDSETAKVNNVVSVGQNSMHLFEGQQQSFIHMGSNTLVTVTNNLYAVDLDSLEVICNVSLPVPVSSSTMYYFNVGDDIYIANEPLQAVLFKFTPSTCATTDPLYSIVGGPGDNYGIGSQPLSIKQDGSLYLVSLFYGATNTTILATVATTTGSNFKILSFSDESFAQTPFIGLIPSQPTQFFTVTPVENNAIITIANVSDYSLVGNYPIAIAGKNQVLRAGPVMGVGDFIILATQANEPRQQSYTSSYMLPMPTSPAYASFPVYGNMVLAGAVGQYVYWSSPCSIHQTIATGNMNSGNSGSNSGSHSGSGSGSSTTQEGISNPLYYSMCIARFDTTVHFSTGSGGGSSGSGSGSSGGSSSAGAANSGAANSASATSGKTTTADNTGTRNPPYGNLKSAKSTYTSDLELESGGSASTGKKIY